MPAVIGWCSPITALLHACLPVRWWIRFAAGTTIKYFRGCRPTGKPRRLKRATGTFLRAGAPFRARACRDWLVQSHNRTATCVPARSVVDSLCCGKATVVETAHWAVSKSHLSNPQSPSAKPEGHSFWNVLLFWWKVVDSNHRSHRRQIYSLFPLATRETFHINFYQLDWSWWTDLNPRPADYKSAALPTELHQHFIKSSCLSDLFSIPHAGVFVNRFVRNYCILFFRSIESDTCCRTVSSALDKSG